MDRTGKAQVTDEVSQALSGSKAVVLADFTGISVEEVTKLRSQIRAKKGKFKVAKNTLVARAFGGEEYAAFRKLLKGPNALAFAYEDPIAILKVLNDFEKESQGKIKIRGGVLDGKHATAEELKLIATLPSRDVLRAQVVGLIASPIQRLLTVLNGPARKLLYALKALEEKKASVDGDPAPQS
jgi:large subunit ribosomal protein L10